MNDLIALAYVSDTTRDLSPLDLDAILLDARIFNAAVGVSGVLFHAPDRFFQFIEGRPDAIDKVMEKIESSASHHNMRILTRAPATQRQFDAWHMGFVHTPQSAIQSLSQAIWEESMPITRSGIEKSEGLWLALDYWNRWAAEAPADSAI